ncbi:MAG: transcriptional regulator, TetR family [Amycolatopsis sp.]|nr:transcriptional regulator, TetR family [Amycolatopsis sp.]
MYRRWPDTTSLVIDTLDKLRPDPVTYLRIGILRDDLIGITRHMTATQTGVKADAFRSLLGEAHRHPQLLARFGSQVLNPLFEAMTDVLREAAARGEISAARLTPVILEVLHALIVKRTLLDKHALTERHITEMVDEVLLPLVA